MVPRSRTPAIPLPAPRPPGTRERSAATTRVEPVGPWAVLVTVRGEVDLVTAAATRRALLAALAAPEPLLLVVDLSEVDFLAAVGLSALVELRDLACARAVDLRLVVGGRAVPRLLDVTGLRRTFRLHSDVDEPLGPHRQSARSR
ncbi:anti-sigma factor antagonist [Actinokineospora diospyrosa]|uniref:Anti-sigma factor antagonist n=1 Tax=Actinokineospora diospyrosa TaxID=103728 RepID=A0ABT1IF15_9PSEU|nr:anti-sigma factor antagonist [Actinokineospora diospyrosa]MCP2271238.1 anti-anti-sigma factor [Actinokineospora diospyrosa]